MKSLKKPQHPVQSDHGNSEIYEEKVPDSTIEGVPSNPSATNELAQNLMHALESGLTMKAGELAMELAKRKTCCNITLRNSGSRNKEAEFSVKVQIEDRESESCIINLKVKASDTIADLKRKVMVLHNFPREVQRWIIGKKIYPDEMRLHQCGVKRSGHTLYLYLVTARSVGLDKVKYEAQRQAIALMKQGSIDALYQHQVSLGRESQTSGGLEQISLPPSAYQQTQQQQQKELILEQAGLSTSLISEISSSSGSHRIQEMLQSPGTPSENVLNHTSPAVAVDAWVANTQASTAGSNITNSSISNSSSGNIEDEDGNNPSFPVQAAVLFPASAPQGRPAVEDEEHEVGWECPTCTYLNLPVWPGCEICDQPRPEGYEVPAGYKLTDRELKLVQEEQMLEKLTREEIMIADAARMQNYQNLLATDDLDLVPNPESFQCAICFDDIDAGEGIMLRECLHQFCKDCLEGAVRHCEDAVLTCPFQDEHYSCKAALQEREVRALVTEELYFKYLQRGLDQAEVQMENSYHCKSPNCPGWCIYEDLVNFFNCPVCHQVNCLTCKAIHMGKNCQQYQEDLRISAENDVSARETHNMLQNLVTGGEAMHCPRCQVIVQKKGGCDWIRCSICHTEICWVTKGPRWGPGGEGDMSGGCKCRLNGKRCHPQCQNCH